MIVTVFLEDLRDVCAFHHPFNSFILQLVMDDNRLCRNERLATSKLRDIEGCFNILLASGPESLVTRLKRDAPLVAQYGPIICIASPFRIRKVLNLGRQANQKDINDAIIRLSRGCLSEIILLPGGLRSLQLTIFEILRFDLKLTRGNIWSRDRVFEHALHLSSVDQRMAIRRKYEALDDVVLAYCTALRKLKIIRS